MTDRDKEKEADLIVDKIMERIYIEMGKSLVKNLFWILVSFGIGIGMYTGFIHIGK